MNKITNLLLVVLLSGSLNTQGNPTIEKANADARKKTEQARIAEQEEQPEIEIVNTRKTEVGFWERLTKNVRRGALLVTSLPVRALTKVAKSAWYDLQLLGSATASATKFTVNKIEEYKKTAFSVTLIATIYAGIQLGYIFEEDLPKSIQDILSSKLMSYLNQSEFFISFVNSIKNYILENKHISNYKSDSNNPYDMVCKANGITDKTMDILKSIDNSISSAGKYIANLSAKTVENINNYLSKIGITELSGNWSHLNGASNTDSTLCPPQQDLSKELEQIVDSAINTTDKVFKASTVEFDPENFTGQKLKEGFIATVKNILKGTDGLFNTGFKPLEKTWVGNLFSW